MLVAAWIAFVLVTLFLLGAAVGSFLNVCIVRLPQGRSLIRPASCCGNCHKPIRSRDNVPLFSYWILRGRCRACGAPFTMRYFWIELLTGLLFVFIYHVEIARNVHHLAVWDFYEGTYGNLLMRMFDDPQPWLFFAVRALFVSFLIVTTTCVWEQRRVPAVVTILGVLMGLTAAVLFPWPWPELPGPRVGESAREGLYPWPIWEPLPEWLPPGSRLLGLATGLGGVLVGAVVMALFRLALNVGVGRRALGWGEISTVMIAGSFLGWQPLVIALALALPAAVVCEKLLHGRTPTICLWLAVVLLAVEICWYWLGPPAREVLLNASRLLALAAFYAIFLVMLVPFLRYGTKETDLGR